VAPLALVDDVDDRIVGIADDETDPGDDPTPA
jgi:hypothetical protein